MTPTDVNCNSPINKLMNMRAIINLLSDATAQKDAALLAEGRSIKLENGRRILADPSRSDLSQMLSTSRILRGELIDDGDAVTLYVWPGRALSHWNAISDLRRSLGIGTLSHVSLKIALDPEHIKEDRYWRDTEPHDCGGYFVAFANPDPHSYRCNLEASPYLARVFPNIGVITTL